jgi:hypothetical protein
LATALASCGPASQTTGVVVMLTTLAEGHSRPLIDRSSASKIASSA